jgi:hypothetical protein
MSYIHYKKTLNKKFTKPICCVYVLRFLIVLLIQTPRPKDLMFRGELIFTVKFKISIIQYNTTQPNNK